jgi:DNA-binding protein HU-beta
MNNQKSVGAIASAVSTSKSAAGETVDAFIALVSKAVVEGEGVQLVGFGTFSLGQRAARTGRNPRTGETLQLLLPQLSNSRRERRSRTS